MKFYDKILKACAGLKIIPTHYSIYVSIGEQKLFLFSGNSLEKTYPVSTSRKAPSCIKDSLGTPTGLHMIDGKIGGGEPLATVFRGRKPDGLLLGEDLLVLGLFLFEVEPLLFTLGL